MWGIANSNYAASSGMYLNPSSMMLMPYTWETTIFGADISLQNNYLAFDRTKATTTAEGTPDPHAGMIDYYNSRNKFARSHVMLQLPSFTFKLKDMAFGFHAAVRNDLSVQNVPAALAKFGYEGIVYTPLHGSSIDLSGVRLGELTWAEVGVSMAKQLSKNPDKKWIVGATLKAIASVQALSLNINSGTLNISNDTMVTLKNFTGEMNTVMPGSPGQVLSVPGRGAGVDLGFCYVSNSNLQRFENGKSVPVKKYDYRIGASLIDLGFVGFGGYTQTTTFNTSYGEYDARGQALDSLLTSNAKKGTFVMSLPTALSIQYDRCLIPKVYFNLSAIQRVPLPMPHIDRPNQLSATLRYESTFFEVDVPYSFYDYYLHRIGFAMRYRFIFVGSDKIGTFVNNTEISGADFYFGIRLTNLDFKGKVKPKKHVCAAYF